MAIELASSVRQAIIASIVRFFHEERGEEIGIIAAGRLLDFVLEEIGPSIHNKALADILKRMELQLSELDIDFHQEEFKYWPSRNRRRG